MATSSTATSPEASPATSPEASPAWVAPPETAAARGKRLKSEPSKSLEDMEESDFSVYDDISEPYWAITPKFEYMNKAMKKQKEAIAEYRKQNRNRGPFDVIAPPPNSNLLGGVVPYTITDDNRPHLIQLCSCALEKYNAENQDANFEFAELVKTNIQVVNGLLHYITFEAKHAADPPNSVTHTFQAKVWDKVRRNAKPEALLCMMKSN